MFPRSLSALMWLALAAYAGPSLTTIQDVLYKADGTRFNGSLTISWSSFQAGDNSAIVNQSTTVKVLDGNLRVQLVPGTTATPAVTYTVTYNSDGRIQFQENWSVPPSTQPLRVRDVRLAAAPSTGSGSAGADTGTTSMPESGVVGLLADLGTRPVKGAGFGVGAAAVIDGSGLLESAVGNATDCLHVDGSSGPCGSPAPSFTDGEVPSGIVDGNNATFTLAGVPNPASSVTVYRNGLLQGGGADYTLSGKAIQFAAASAPQPGDILLASYRLSSGTTGSSPAYPTTQVLCSGTGTTANSATLSNIGSCFIPGGILLAGDRVEIRFDLSHQGTAAGFAFELDWGSTAVLQRTGAATDVQVAGRADAAILVSGAQWNSQSWGTVLAFAAGVGNSTAAYGAGLTINFQGSATGGDAVTLAEFSVVRVP